MTLAWNDALRKATLATLQDLGFLFPLDEMGPAQKSAAPEALVTVPFTGPVNGKIEVRFFGCILPPLAANMLGEDSPDEKLQKDAAGELGNVLCGNFLPSLGDNEAVFDIHAPRAFIPPPPPEKTRDAFVDVGVDEGRLEVSLHIDGEKPHD